MSSTPRKPSTPFQLWREEHIKQELGVQRSVLGQTDSLPANTARISMEVMEAAASPRRTSEPARKYPPTKLYIEDEPEKKVETFRRWKQQRREQEEDTVSETRHLSELEREIEIVQSRERSRDRSRQASGESQTSGQMARSDPPRKKDKKSSISSILSVFSRKKSSNSSVKKKKSSLTAMMEKEAAGSVLDPEAQKKIIEQPEAERSMSPYQEWRSFRSQHETSEPDHTQVRHSVTPLSLRSPTPDPDYDNLSFQSNSPRAPRIRPSYDDNSSDTSFEDYGGRYTPRSTASEYGRNIPRYQPMPNLLSGLPRGVSPATSETAGAKRSPSTESFFGKNGASVGQQANSQIWYQKYKHSSFSHPNQTSFGEPIYGAFDGRISKFRGKTREGTQSGTARHLYLHSAILTVKHANGIGLSLTNIEPTGLFPLLMTGNSSQSAGTGKYYFNNKTQTETHVQTYPDNQFKTDAK